MTGRNVMIGLVGLLI